MLRYPVAFAALVLAALPATAQAQEAFAPACVAPLAGAEVSATASTASSVLLLFPKPCEEVPKEPETPAFVAVRVVDKTESFHYEVVAAGFTQARELGELPERGTPADLLGFVLEGGTSSREWNLDLGDRQVALALAPVVNSHSGVREALVDQMARMLAGKAPGDADPVLTPKHDPSLYSAVDAGVTVKLVPDDVPVPQWADPGMDPGAATPQPNAVEQWMSDHPEATTAITVTVSIIVTSLGNSLNPPAPPAAGNDAQQRQQEEQDRLKKEQEDAARKQAEEDRKREEERKKREEEEKQTDDDVEGEKEADGEEAEEEEDKSLSDPDAIVVDIPFDPEAFETYLNERKLLVSDEEDTPSSPPSDDPNGTSTMDLVDADSLGTSSVGPISWRVLAGGGFTDPVDPGFDPHDPPPVGGQDA